MSIPMIRLTGVGLAVLASVAATGTTAGPAFGDPAPTGCPRGYEVLAVADLAPQGYQVPGKVDDPTSGLLSFGNPGNGDGLVCAQEIGGRTTSWGGQLYNFMDNTQHS